MSLTSLITQVLRNRHANSSICFGEFQARRAQKPRPARKFVLKKPRNRRYCLKSAIQLHSLVSRIEEALAKVLSRASKFRQKILDKLMRRKIKSKASAKQPKSPFGRNFKRLQHLKKQPLTRVIGRIAICQEPELKFDEYLQRSILEGRLRGGPCEVA